MNEKREPARLGSLRAGSGKRRDTFPHRRADRLAGWGRHLGKAQSRKKVSCAQA